MTATETLDVLIIGAGLSGIGAACWLTREAPGRAWAVVEARADLGGTWDLFRYPGVRSDSDLYTFGYDFKPWTSGKAIAGAPEILAYLREAADEHGVTPKIRFRRRVIAADWSSAAALWTVRLRHEEDGSESQLRARWIFGATGYYDYAEGHRPHFPGEETYQGPILHPQFWPEDFDATGKRIAVIGSGATAVTLVPALAGTAEHVTQVQRTPTYVLPVPSGDGLATLARRLLPARRAHAFARRKNILQQRWVWLLCQKYPRTARRIIRRVNRRALPKGFDVDRHFNPPYGPWDQRLCAVPDGDFYAAIREGRASVVTGALERFTPTGLRMQDGTEIAADAVVTATGLKLQLFGGATLSVDGAEAVPSEKLVFKGMMLSGVPNFCFAIGYTNASWTLKIGLLCEHFCRLLNHMAATGTEVCTPVRPSAGLAERPLMDFQAGYVLRSLAMLPRQGDRDPWTMTFDYLADVKTLRHGPVDDPALRFSPAPAREAAA